MAEVYSSPRQDDLHSSDTESNSSYLMKSPVGSGLSEDEQSLGATQYLSISRPLSRSSVTSGLSVTATKDGIEGKRVKRRGIPGYPLNLIEKMYANYVTHSNTGLDDEDFHDDKGSVESLKSMSMSSMIPQYSRPATPDSASGEVYGEDTVEFEKESRTDYEKFLHSHTGSDAFDEGLVSLDGESKSLSM